jgi:hypothetical protein
MSGRHTLIPVFSDGYRGHLLLTCRGWRACDEEDREIGRYETKERLSRRCWRHPRRSSRRNRMECFPYASRRRSLGNSLQ